MEPKNPIQSKYIMRSENLKSTVARIASDTYASATANLCSLNASHDAYHLQMGIRNYGEENFLHEASRILQQRNGCSYIEATAEVARRMTYALEMIEGTHTFRDAHMNLKEAERQQRQTALTHHAAF